IIEIIEHGKNGLLISPEDYVSLAKAIVTLLNDEAFMESIGRNARKRVLEKFSVDRMASETAEYYEIFDKISAR
ncbi:MAG: glycosyltransferase, partial [Ignavibacteriaceae bacterium]